MMKILVTTANGMFGNQLVRELAASGAAVRAMVRNRAQFTFEHPHVEVVTGDLDDPATLRPVLEGAQRIFLASPMDPRLATRECAVIDAARDAGVRTIAKIYGAVKHGHDALGQMHETVIGALRESGLSWCLVSPNSVMETSLLGLAGSIKQTSMFYGISGHGKIGFIALDDVVRATARILTSDDHEGQNYELTGPQSLSLYAVADAFSRTLGRRVTYHDVAEEEMRRLLSEALPGMTDEQLELNVLCHLRCWRDGKSDLVTGTYERLMGAPPTSIEAWIRNHAHLF